MLSKARLIKKQSLDQVPAPEQTTTPVSEKREGVLFSQYIAQTTKDWLTSRREQQNNARQSFAALFGNSDAQSNAI